MNKQEFNALSLKSNQGNKFLVWDTYQPGTLYLCEQGCEDPWSFFEAIRGPREREREGGGHVIKHWNTQVHYGVDVHSSAESTCFETAFHWRSRISEEFSCASHKYLMFVIGMRELGQS